MPHIALKALPVFNTEAEERTFWKTHDATDYLDLSKAQRVTFANLKPSTHSIALRLPAHMLEGIKCVGWVATKRVPGDDAGFQPNLRADDAARDASRNEPETIS